MKRKRLDISAAIERTNFRYVKNGKWFLIGSGALAFIGLIVMIFAGFNLGLDFTGGNIIEIKMGATVDTNYDSYIKEVENILKNNGLTLAASQKAGEGAERSIIIRYQIPKDLEDEATNEMNVKVVKELKDAFSAAVINESESIGPSASATLLLNACAAILIAVVCILIYIAIRFEMAYGLASIFALMHDVIIMLAFVAIFRIQVNSSFVAAIITIIGYSINNTIVVFDRIRENRKKANYIGQDVSVMVDDSVKQTLTRSIFTAFTTLLAVILLAIIGVASLREFIIPIIFGLIAGTYSSIFLAAPLWAWMRKGKVQESIKK